jgi:hypothetical protein
MAISTNGIDWQRLYRAPVLTNFSRDASIIKYNGEFATVYTDAFTGPGGTFGLATSTNLINWTVTNVTLHGPAITNTPNNTWAPEWFVDGTNYYVAVRSSQTSGQNYGPPGLGYMQCFDPGTWANWGPFTLIPGIDSWENDPFILKVDNTYHLFTDRGGRITHRTSTTGPFEDYGPAKTISDSFTNTLVYSNAVQEGLWYIAWEGSFVLPLGGDQYRLYFQGIARDRSFSIDSTDGMETWDLSTMRDLFYDGAKAYGHGSVIALNATDALVPIAAMAQRADQAITELQTIQTNPNAYSLYTSTQYMDNRAAGRADVLADPADYGLFTSSSIMDLNLGGVMIERHDNATQLGLQIQSTADLSTPFTNHGPPLQIPIDLPNDKHFLRIRALGSQ